MARGATARRCLALGRDCATARRCFALGRSPDGVQVPGSHEEESGAAGQHHAANRSELRRLLQECTRFDRGPQSCCGVQCSGGMLKRIEGGTTVQNPGIKLGRREGTR